MSDKYSSEIDEILLSVKYSEKGGLADKKAKAKLEALITEQVVAAYKNGYVDAVEKKSPKYLLGFDPLNLPVEDKK